MHQLRQPAGGLLTQHQVGRAEVQLCQMGHVPDRSRYTALQFAPEIDPTQVDALEVEAAQVGKTLEE
ncbi:hypothetical protein D3C86_2108010 [compost metagenome]